MKTVYFISLYCKSIHIVNKLGVFHVTTQDVTVSHRALYGCLFLTHVLVGGTQTVYFHWNINRETFLTLQIDKNFSFQ